MTLKKKKKKLDSHEPPIFIIGNKNNIRVKILGFNYSVDTNIRMKRRNTPIKIHLNLPIKISLYGGCYKFKPQNFRNNKLWLEILKKSNKLNPKAK